MKSRSGIIREENEADSCTSDWVKHHVNKDSDKALEQYSLFLEEIRQLDLYDLKMFDPSKTSLDDFYCRELGINISWHKHLVFVLRLFSPWVMTKQLLKEG